MAVTVRETCLLLLLLIALIGLANSDIVRRSSSSLYAKDSLYFVPSPSSKSDVFRSRVSWSDPSQIPPTVLISHVPGWTILSNLYILNGTVFVVTDEPEKIPDRSLITSTSRRIENGPEERAKRLPTDEEMQIISLHQADVLFNQRAEVIDGVTWMVNDPPQFITHYYHWSAELFFGFWRTYSSLDPHVSPTGNTRLPAPRRVMFTHADADHWRDYASMNELVFRSAFPSTAMEFSADWHDRTLSAHPYLLDRVVFSDRAAAMYGHNFARTGRTASEPFSLPGSVYWWSAIRNNVVGVAGVDASSLSSSHPVITYISRQEWGRRMLKPEDHDRLVEELYKLRDTYGYEVNVVSMDKLSRLEQIRLAARTTIMMGVHGNGLTSLVWMNPTPQSTVMEFFFPGGFAHDYEYTTRALGMLHFGFWNDHTFSSPDLPPVNYPEGFQGKNIPIDGAAVARLCLERLRLSAEADD